MEQAKHWLGGGETAAWVPPTEMPTWSPLKPVEFDAADPDKSLPFTWKQGDIMVTPREPKPDDSGA
jgi:hypothetical protein